MGEQLMTADRRTGSRQGRALPSVLRFYWVWLTVLAAIAAVMGDFYYHIGRFNDCCMAQSDQMFVDFWHYHYIFSTLHTAAFFQGSDRFAYPAPSAVLYDLLYHLGPHTQAIYLSMELVICAVAAAVFYAVIRREGLRRFPASLLVVCTLLFSFPLQVMFESGNIEFVLCVLTAAGLWALVKKQNGLAASLWGLAAAMKIYPILLLALFLSRKQWRYLILGLAAFIGASWLSMWFVGPTLGMAFQGTVHGIDGFVSSYAQRVRVMELQGDHSLLSPIKQFAYLRIHRRSVHLDLTRPYIAVAATAAVLAFFLRVRKMPLVNRVLFLAAAMVSLPPVSYGYTLLHLYAPWALLVLAVLHADASGCRLPDLRVEFVCFAILFTSQNYIFYNYVHIQGMLGSLALLVLMIAVLLHPIPDSLLFGPEWACRAEVPLETPA